MSNLIKDVLLPESGPYAIPLLAKLVSIDAIEKDFLVARFELENGEELHSPISTMAAAGLLAGLKVWRIKHAEIEAEDQQKH